MPAYALKMGRKWRVVHGHPPLLVRGRPGGRKRLPVDSGGYASRLRAAAQARAINAREGGYPRRPARTRRNPAEGTVLLVWICPLGQVLEIPKGHTHATAVPDALGRGRIRSANENGFFKGAVINRRLYVERDGRRRPDAQTMKGLKSYASSRSLSRGVVIEPMR